MNTPHYPPESDLNTSIPEIPRPRLEIDGPSRQARITVAFRLLLALPQYIVGDLLVVALLPVLIAGWLAALATGRLPGWIQQFFIKIVGYVTRVTAYTHLLVDHYPPFSFNAPNYPVRIELYPARSLNRAAVFFRFMLIAPAAVVSAVLSAGWQICALFLWVTVLISGRAPEPVFGATAAWMRYSLRAVAYFLMLTSSYPTDIYGDDPPGRSQESDRTSSAGKPDTNNEDESTMSTVGTSHGRLILSRGSKALLTIFLIVGVLGFVGNEINGSYVRDQLHCTPTGPLARFPVFFVPNVSCEVHL